MASWRKIRSGAIQFAILAYGVAAIFAAGGLMGVLTVRAVLFYCGILLFGGTLDLARGLPMREDTPRPSVVTVIAWLFRLATVAAILILLLFWLVIKMPHLD